MKANGRREYVKSKRKFVLVSTYLKKVANIANIPIYIYGLTSYIINAITGSKASFILYLISSLFNKSKH